MVKVLISATISLLIISCSPRVMPYESVVTDSVIVNTVETIRDTVVVIEKDSSLIRALLECDSMNQVVIKKITSYKAGADMPLPEISIKDNILEARASIDERELLIKLKEQNKELIRKVSKDTIRVVEVNKLHLYQKILMWLGVALLMYVSILIIKLIKFK